MKVRIFTDGACSGNPGPGGWAAAILFPTGKQEITGYEPDTTNNRMELTAVTEAVKLAVECKYNHIDVYSDSAYIVDAINNCRLEAWKLNGWKTKEHTPVKNKDLWMDLSKSIAALRKTRGCINFIKVKGHADIKYNIRVDELAKREIKLAAIE
jgi:ribonuclease HI